MFQNTTVVAPTGDARPSRVLYLEGKSPLLMRKIQVNFLLETSKMRILGYALEFQPRIVALVQSK